MLTRVGRQGRITLMSSLLSVEGSSMHNFTDELSKSSKMMKSNEKEIHNLSKTIKTAMTLSRTSKVTKLTSRMKSELRK